jgi:predicted dehydrogenase
MRAVMLALVLGAATVASAQAQPAANATSAGKDAVAQQRAARTLYICDTSAETRRGFAREFGAAEYVSAAEATAKGGEWAAPKCIKQSEARRLKMRQLASR